MPTLQDSVSTVHSDSIGPSVTVVPVPAESYELPRNFAQADASGFTTIIVDSISADTVKGRIPHFIPAEDADSLRVEALIDSMQTTATIPYPASGASEGLAPLAIAPKAADTPLSILMVGTLLLAAFNARGVARAIKRYSHALWSVRRRPNVFDDERTVPLPVVILLSLVFVVFGGVVLYNLPGLPPSPCFAGAAASMLLLGGYYIFQYCAYRLVAFAFATPDGRRQWLDGFIATQAFSGLAMVLPAFLLVYEPEWRYVLVVASLSIYFIGRILFISKGFRIFYSRFRSLLYFILYLCTLEIVPMLAIYRLNVYLWAYTA